MTENSRPDPDALLAAVQREEDQAQRGKLKIFFFYIAVVGGFAVAIWLMLQWGKTLEENKIIEKTFSLIETQSIFSQIAQNLKHPLSILTLQIVTIIMVARIFSVLFKKIGQPAVIGEIAAGIALGPSLLGWLLPEFSAFLFPAASLSNLQFLSQVGLILFMFVIGLELDSRNLQHQAREAVIVSHASIIFPFFLGVLLSFATYEKLAPDHVTFVAFALFMGIAMSITAFPVLARIVQERGLTEKPVGAMAITCAAADDVTAWCLLALVIAIVKAGAIASALLTVLVAVLYVLFMFFAVKPRLEKVGAGYSGRETISRPIVALVFILLLLSCWITEVIGIHALFGAFIAGVVMPQNAAFKRIMTEKIEDVALVLLLPLFFVFTGLRTKIGLLNDAHLGLVCLLVIGVAIVGKLGGSAVAARFVGKSWKDSLAIGILMNTRGLMELVVLNIAYDAGVLSDEMFAMLVLMALVTTFMTGPVLDLVERLFPEKSALSLSTSKKP
jgi:Kef-type K+ transport system membrane component KefB